MEGRDRLSLVAGILVATLAAGVAPGAAQSTTKPRSVFTRVNIKDLSTGERLNL